MTLHAMLPACQATVIFHTMSVRTLITPTLKSVQFIHFLILEPTRIFFFVGATYRQWPGVWWSNSCVIYEHRTCREPVERPCCPQQSGWEGSKGMPTAPSFFFVVFVCAIIIKNGEEEEQENGYTVTVELQRNGLEIRNDGNCQWSINLWRRKFFEPSNATADIYAEMDVYSVGRPRPIS